MEVKEEQMTQVEGAAAGKPGKEKKPLNVKKEILSWILTIAVAVAAALLIRTFLFEPIRVDGESMCDTLQDGEIMLVTKPEYLFVDPQRGDVVICKYPGRTENFVKRVMGIPGDVIEIRSNVVYRNGEALDEPYLTPERNDNGFSMAPFTLGEDEYFVMGDNRDNSHDSRNYYDYFTPAALTRDMIIGHVRCVVFPFSDIRTIEYAVPDGGERPEPERPPICRKIMLLTNLFQGREGCTVLLLSQGTLTASPVAVPAIDRTGKILCDGGFRFQRS